MYFKLKEFVSWPDESEWLFSCSRRRN